MIDIISRIWGNCWQMDYAPLMNMTSLIKTKLGLFILDYFLNHHAQCEVSITKVETTERLIWMLYNYGMIFFYLIIFVNYILSFGLVRLWTVRFLVQLFTLALGGCDNHKCHNKKTQMGYETGVWITSCQEAMAWEFWWFLKKAVCWDLNSGEDRPAESYGMHGTFVGSVSWDWTLSRPVQLGRWLKDDVGTVSIVKIVSFTPRVEKLKVKKVNKRFVPEIKKVVSVSGFLCIWTFYIWVFWICYKKIYEKMVRDT